MTKVGEIEMTEKKPFELEEEPVKKLNVFALFRYSDSIDVFLTITSAIAAIVSGLLIPGKFQKILE